MCYYVTWDTFVFLQVSMPRWFGKCTTVRSLGILGSIKQWQYCRSISIGWTFNMTSGSTFDPTFPVPLPNHPSRSKASILHFLPLFDLGGKTVSCHCMCGWALPFFTEVTYIYVHNLLPTPSIPWESISMDYMLGLPSTKHDNDCVFVVIYKFSKMAIMAAWKKNIIAEATTKLFFERMWVHFGIT